jgi:hypothetical protein
MRTREESEEQSKFKNSSYKAGYTDSKEANNNHRDSILMEIYLWVFIIGFSYTSFELIF